MIAITTKYEPGSTVWTMVDDKPRELTVKRIFIRIEPGKNRIALFNIEYELTCDLGRVNREEMKLAATKEELKEKVFGK